MNAKIINHNGSPAISINGKIHPPMTATITTCRIGHGKEGRDVDLNYFKGLGDAGIRIFYVMCNNLDIDKNAVEEFEKEANAILSVVPDAYFMVRFCLHPSAEWCENNPDELVQFTDGREIPTLLTAESAFLNLKGFPSLCSQKWRDDMGECMVKTIEKIKALPCGERIAGIFLAGGGTSEWYYRPEIEDFSNGAYGDVSPAFKREFAQYLDNEYGKGKVEPIIPNIDDRYYAEEVDRDMADPGRKTPFFRENAMPKPILNGSNYGVFADLDNNRHTYDFYRAWHDGVANTILHFAKLVKQNFEGTLVGAFFGGIGCSEVFYGGNVIGVKKLIGSGLVDFLANPPVYENRQPGGMEGIRQCYDSYRLNNAIYIVEDDTRTLAENAYQGKNFYIFNMEDTLNVLKRDFGRTVCEDLQSWWFDQHIGGGRYKYPEVYSLFARQQEIAHEAYSLDRKKNSEIAFICDEESFVAASKHTTAELIELFRGYEFYNVGAPIDCYLSSDLDNPYMPDYKLYIFANCIYLNDEKREVIKQKLRKNGAVALFLYGGGLMNPDKETKVSTDNMKDVLGFGCSAIMENHSAIFRFRENAHPLCNALDSGEMYGQFIKMRYTNACCDSLGYDPSSLCPVISPDEEGCTVLADFLSTKTPAVALKENDGYTAIYYGAKYINADIVREFARFAGCHIYEETGHVFTVNNHFLSIHASHSGMVNIKLPEKRTAFELYEGKNYSENSDVLTFNIKKGQTKTFRLKKG